MQQVVHRSKGNFQELYQMRTYLQQISIYLMENLMPRIWLSEFQIKSEVEKVGAEVLESFCSLMEGLEGQGEFEVDAEVMPLLEEFLPKISQGIGWDDPLVASLADALSLTSQLPSVVSHLVKKATKQKFGSSSRKALKILEEAFQKVLKVLQETQQKQDKQGQAASGNAVEAVPHRSHGFVVLVLARELVTHSVLLVDKALENQETARRFDRILGHIVEILQLPLVNFADSETETELCSGSGRSLRVSQLPSPFAALFVVAATRRREDAYATNATVRTLFDVIALKGSGTRLHALLAKCRAESETFSNAFGLSMLLPDRTGKPDVQEVAQCLQDMGDQGHQGRSAQAAERFVELCHARNSFQEFVPYLRALGEVVSLQCTAQDDQILQQAVQIARKLPDMVLGPAGDLLRQVAEDTEWNIDFLNRDGQNAWHTSIIAHVLCLVGAAHESINKTRQVSTTKRIMLL